MLTHGYWHDFTVSILKCEEVMKIYRDHPYGLKLYCCVSPYHFILHNTTKHIHKCMVHAELNIMQLMLCYIYE